MEHLELTQQDHQANGTVLNQKQKREEMVNGKRNQTHGKKV